MRVKRSDNEVSGELTIGGQVQGENTTLLLLKQDHKRAKIQRNWIEHTI